jgi:hypothetical protein
MKRQWVTGLIAIAFAVSVTGCTGMSHDQQSPSHQQHGGHEHDHMEKTAAVKTNWSFSPQQLKAGQSASLSIQVVNPDGKPVQDFAINHEKKMHLIVVSKDLSFFEHLHPQYKGNGSFQVNVPFPAGGEYRLFADFQPKGEAQVTQMQTVSVSGTKSAEKPIQPDANLTKVVDGKKVTLSFDQPLKAKKPVMLTFSFRDAQSNQPIKNLQPYLGAIGHVVILDQSAKEYLHVHPMNENTTGPDAQFHAEFPHSGAFKVWGEFQHRGKVFTVPFVIRVS